MAGMAGHEEQKEDTMAPRKNKALAAPAPAHRAWIQAYGVRAWDHAQEHQIGAKIDPREAIDYYWPGFLVAFEVAFGRAPHPGEVELLRLYWLEREHVHLAARGLAGGGFHYFADMPPKALVALRARFEKLGIEPLPAPVAVQGGDWWRDFPYTRGDHAAREAR